MVITEKVRDFDYDRSGFGPVPNIGEQPRGIRRYRTAESFAINKRCEGTNDGPFITLKHRAR